MTTGGVAAALFCCAAASAAPNEARMAECHKLLQAAYATAIIDDIRLSKGRDPAVMVGAGFFKLPYGSREGFARAMSCLLVQGETGVCMNFDMLHWQSGAPVARYENCVYKPR